MSSLTLKNKIVLIADDYTVNTMLFSAFVEEAGGTAITASNGVECLEMVKSRHVDLILMDVNMPEMDGIAATVAIRALPCGRDIKIIGITGYEDHQEISECLQAGMDEALTKLSFSYEKFLNVTTKMCGKSDSETREDSIIPAQSNTGNTCVLDYPKALKEFENNKPLLDELLKEFKNTLFRQLNTMILAVDTLDVQFIYREAHSIKGGAANLCAQSVSESARALEIACKNGAVTKEQLSDLLTILKKSADEFSDRINQIETDFCKSSD